MCLTFMKFLGRGWKNTKKFCLFEGKYKNKEQQEDLKKITQVAKVTRNQIHTEIIVNSVTWVML